MANRSEKSQKKFEDQLAKLQTKYGSKEESKEVASLPTSEPSKPETDTSAKEAKQAQRVKKFDDHLAKLEARYNKSASVNDTYISTFLEDAQSFLNRASSVVKGLDWKSATSSEKYDSWNKQYTSLQEKEDKIRSYLRENKDTMDTSSYKQITSLLDTFHWSSVDAKVAFANARKHYSQWETEEDYLTWKKETEEYEALKNFDTKKGEDEVQYLEKVLNEYKALSRTMIDDRMQERLDYITANYGDEKGIKTLISEKQQYLNRAKHIQEGITLAGVINNDDFKENSGYVSTKSDERWSKLTSDFGMGYNDLTYEYINGGENGMRHDIIDKAVAYDADTDKFFVYDYMTDDQISTYNYYYAKNGKEAAEKYLNSIQESLNYQAATERYSKMEGKTALELLFGIEAGVDQFQSGVKNLFNTEDSYIAQSSTQMLSGMIREDLADAGPNLPDWLGGASLGQAGYDAITTTANMAPSIMTSTVANIIIPGSGAVVGNAMMFASSAGNAYQEALNLGYDKKQARTYSTLVGASEAGLQYLLGGISSLGGKISGNVLTKMMSGVDNAFARFAINFAGNMVSEGLEEGLQEILTPWFKNLTMHANEKVNWSEVAYSTLLGALTAGIMEGPSSIATEVNTYRSGRKLQDADISATRLAEIGKTFSADTVAYQLAGRVNESTGAYTMGRLFNEIGASLSEQNVTEITEALVAKGMDRATAQKNAKALAYVVEGGQLSDTQIAMIEANDVLAEVARTTLIDANTTWNQRSKGYNETLMALAQEKTSRTNPAQQAQENAPTTDTVDIQNENGTQALAEAETVDTSPANVKSISKIENGQVTVKLADGTEINVKEADLSVDDGVRIDTIAKLENISAADANFILNTLRTNNNTSAQMDSLGAREVWKYGFYGFSQEHMATHGVFSNSLTESQRKAIYETARAARQKQVDAKQAVAKNATTSNKDSNKGKVHYEGDRNKLTERQSASLTAMEKIADALGVQIYVFESKLNERGKRVGANGWYDPKDSSIHVDLYAGENGAGTMLFTLAHELTHHIRKWSPAKFKILADFLMQEYGKKGVNVDALVREQMAKAKRNGRTISYDTAYEEVVADSMEMMLSDGNVMKRLEKLKAQDMDLWQKIKSFIDEIAAKIRAVYKGMSPDSVEGRYVADMGKTIYRLQELFAEGLMDAAENYQSSLTPGEEGVVANEVGEPVAYSTEDGSVLLSMRTYDEEGRKELRKYLEKCVSSNKLTKAEMQEMMDGIEDIYQTCKEFKDKYAPFSSWSDAAVVRDTYGKPVFSVVTPNGDYKMNLDFSLVCKKRRTLDAVFNEMSKRGIIDDFELGQKSVVKINEIIRRHGLETACALCFVDAKRFRQASMADSFTKLYNELVESLVPEDQRSNIDHFNFSGYDTIKKVESGIHTWDASKLDFSHLNEVMKNYGSGTVEHKAAKYIKSHAEGRRLLLRGDFMSSQGFDAVKTQNKDILKLYNSKKGTGGPKAAFGDVQYMNEIVKKARTWTPAKAYAVGGVRIQSFSDYVPRMVFDYVQMIYDLAATKLPAHAYTKEALFVKQFGLTGVKINMSLIPAIAEGGIAPGLDANGNYVWAGESFDYETAKEIQNAEGYTENCGTICVGVSDRHIRKLLSDPDIRMVIPYHKSGLNPIVAHMNKIAEFADYTNKQNTTVKATGAKAEEHFDFNKALHDMGENADPKAVIQQYFDWCDDNGYDPKFADFRDHPNYYKLIEDFTLYDKDGKYVPQREVKAAFPKEGSAFGSMKDLIQEGLQEDAVVEGKRDSSLSSIVDEIQKTLPKTEAEIAEEQVEQADRDLEELKLSDRDSDGNQLSKEQQEFFKDSKVRWGGKLMPVHHGTRRKFTVFDAAEGYDENRVGGLLWAAKDAEYAEGFASLYEPIIMNGYLNITNPLDIGDIDSYANYESRLQELADLVKLTPGELEAMANYDSGLYIYDITSSKGFRDRIVELGYDGVIAYESGNQTFGFVDSNQFKNTDNKNPTSDPDIRYSFRGTNQDGIEVYETSDDVKKLTYKERQKQFLDIMTNEYRGRTAKFIRNGHAYYATFDEKDVNKNIYGDKRSDKKGYKAKINTGADGDIFELVENAKYNGSLPEKGKKITAHKGVGYWDYFIKNVQVDGIVYDLTANVRKKADGAFVYSIQLNENKKIKASPPLGLLSKALNGVTNASGDMVSQPDPNVNLHSDRDSDGNQLSEDQQEFFAESKARDENGNLYVMYHGSRSPIFTEFDLYEGVWMTPDQRYAEVYAEMWHTWRDEGKKAKGLESSVYADPDYRLYKMYANITNPLDLGEINDEFDRSQMNRLARLLGVPASRIRNISHHDGYQTVGFVYEVTKDHQFIEIAKEKGYDGFTATEKGRKTFCAFSSPNQVKLTTNEVPSGFYDIRYSDRDTESVSNRSLLANAFEGVAQNDAERQRIQEYKEKISLINAEERKLIELNEKIKELSFAKGPKDTKTIRSLQFDAKQAANRINTYDKQLLRLEASKPLQDVLTREKNMAYQRAEKKGKEALEAYREKTMKTQRELIDRWQESRKRGIESRQRTAMRHKIKDVVNELNQYLLHGTKDRHVPIELQKAVAEALDAVNMDTVGAEERIAKLQAEMMKAKSPETIQEISRKIDHIREMGDNMSEKLKKLKAAYDEIINSDDPLIANSHDDGISSHMMTLIVRVGDTPLREMNMDQLQDVYDVYRMVLTTIRNANKAFKAKKSESISIIANRVMEEVEKAGGKNKLSRKGTEGIKSLFWNNLKPVYAFEHIGSESFTEVFNNVRSGEDVWATDVTEAREFYLDKSKKHSYDSWDFKKRFTFTSTSGMEFSLDLEQIMSLYAYSKRDQAADHLKKGGIVIDETTEITIKNKLGIPVKFNPTEATAYNLSDETLASIISKLTDEQKSFVDEMQDYLSTVMGAKGNEVALEMYGIKLFKEKFYFPLKSAQQFMAKAKEQQKGEIKIKNSGFSKETVQKASNPIVLTPFMNVWADHVNEMSMYHAFVLPMEDFYRVYNYKTPTSETMATESVEMFLQNAYGKGATKYIDQLLKDLNGGARTDHTTGIINKMMGLFKKGAVFASLSVVVQQPSAIARAAALVDTKYFIGPKVDHKKHAELWDEVKQYAPVAVIKEMGYFDTNMGKSTQDFILGKEHSGFNEKMKALFTDSGFRDEALSKAPALADEIAWCGIWEAVKRETKAKNPGMDVRSEAFLKKAGERFTEVIVKTQVYDSVLSRSGLMRSKDTGMKMATAFMAEPTTSINMIADALLQGKRGNRKYARSAIGAVIASQILNSILVSFVYAGRDDDEDETYMEKYIGTLSGEMLDSLNPAGYIPFIKDIMSIVQGYDVERSDMAIISDLWKAWENLSKDNVSVYRKVEGFAGSIAQIFGLPVKNIMRDARGIYQTIDSFVNGQQTTKTGIGYAVKGAITGKTVSNDQQLYEAIMSGDQAQIARVKSRFKDQSSINSAIRKALRANDPRIQEAAIAWNANDLDEYMRIAKEIIAEKKFAQDDVVMAIRAAANALVPDDGTPSTSSAKGLFTAEKFAEAIAQGDQATANAIKIDLIQTAQKNGKTEKEAKESFASSAKGDLKELYLAGSLSEAKAIDALVKYCDESRDEAAQRVAEWGFEGKHGFKYSDKKQQFVEGNISASEMKNILMTVEGKTEEEANSSIVSYTRDAYDDGFFNRGEAADIMVTYGGLTEEESEAKLRYIDIKRQFPDTYVDDAWVDEYYKEVESSGISIEVFVDYRNQVKSITGKDKKEGRMAVINSMPISNAQKDALYFAEGWAASKLYEAPWR